MDKNEKHIEAKQILKWFASIKKERTFQNILQFYNGGHSEFVLFRHDIDGDGSLLVHHKHNPGGVQYVQRGEFSIRVKSLFYMQVYSPDCLPNALQLKHWREDYANHGGTFIDEPEDFKKVPAKAVNLFASSLRTGKVYRDMVAQLCDLADSEVSWLKEHGGQADSDTKGEE